MIEHVFRQYGVVVLLEEEEYIDDMIEGVQQEYQKNYVIQEEEKQKRSSGMLFMSLTQVLQGNISTIKARYSGDLSERKKADDYLDKVTTDMRFHFCTLNYVLNLSSKFAHCQFYVLKRIDTLVNNPADYNFKGGSKFMLYKGQSWSKELPSDPEIISMIFARILDDGYFAVKEKVKLGVPHYLDSTKIHYKINEDQIGMINNQPIGYLPYYQYIYKN